MKNIIVASTVLALLAGAASAQVNQINNESPTLATAGASKNQAPASMFYTSNELLRAGLDANDQISLFPTQQVIASTIYSTKELSRAGLDADTLVTVSVASTSVGNTQPEGGRD